MIDREQFNALFGGRESDKELAFVIWIIVNEKDVLTKMAETPNVRSFHDHESHESAKWLFKNGVGGWSGVFSIKLYRQFMQRV